MIENHYEHKHKVIAVATGMGEGREIYIGELIETLPEYPGETHCLHWKSPEKNIEFLCNMADFRHLMIICNIVVGGINQNWLGLMKDHALQLAKEQQQKEEI